MQSLSDSGIPVFLANVLRNAYLEGPLPSLPCSHSHSRETVVLHTHTHTNLRYGKAARVDEAEHDPGDVPQLGHVDAMAQGDKY